MREPRAIVEAFHQAQVNGNATALATVVAVKGSAYRRPGARMLITEEGRTTGTISGGCLERDVILRAQRAIERRETSLVAYDSTDEDDIDFGVGLGCGGLFAEVMVPAASVRRFRRRSRCRFTRAARVLAGVARNRGGRKACCREPHPVSSGRCGGTLSPRASARSGAAIQ